MSWGLHGSLGSQQDFPPNPPLFPGIHVKCHRHPPPTDFPGIPLQSPEFTQIFLQIPSILSYSWNQSVKSCSNFFLEISGCALRVSPGCFQSSSGMTQRTPGRAEGVQAPGAKLITLGFFLLGGLQFGFFLPCNTNRR